MLMGGSLSSSYSSWCRLDIYTIWIDALRTARLRLSRQRRGWQGHFSLLLLLQLLGRDLELLIVAKLVVELVLSWLRLIDSRLHLIQIALHFRVAHLSKIPSGKLLREGLVPEK
jgi:hypothetical protein